MHTPNSKPHSSGCIWAFAGPIGLSPAGIVVLPTIVRVQQLMHQCTGWNLIHREYADQQAVKLLRASGEPPITLITREGIGWALWPGCEILRILTNVTAIIGILTLSYFD